MNQSENSRFLGTEKISKLMLKFSIPCVLSLLVSALYNIVDQIFIGNSSLSALGNAATGVVFPIFIIAQAFAWCFGDGCAAYLNICQGKNDSKTSHKAIGTGVIVTLITSIILIALFLPFKTSLLTLFGASENSIGYAVEYFNIVLLFFPILMLSNMMNSVIRADGNPAGSMASMLTGAVVNIILDPIFIFGINWGGTGMTPMTGAATATIIGQIVSFVISVFYFFKPKTFKLTPSSFIPDLKTFSNALKLGTSSFITQMTIVVISLVCNIMLAKYGAMSSYGIDIPIAIIGIESKVFTVVINLVVGIVLGCQPIIGYNIGAKNYMRVKELYKKILFCTIVIGVVATILFEFVPRNIIGVFGTPTNIPNPEDYWIFGEKTFRIFLCFITFTCIVKMTSIFFQAAGKSGQAIISSMIRDIVCFIPLIIIFPAIFGGVEAILYAAPVADFIAMIVATFITIKFFKSLEKYTPEKTEYSVILKSKPGFIVTIAREHGSSGKQIGKIIAEKLNIPFYYKEVTALAAQESGLDKEFISDINRNSPKHLHELYLSTNVIQQAVVAQDQIIKKIAENGSCVIVGRAADYVLNGHADMIRIFIYASKEYKISRIMEIYGDSSEEAENNIRRADEARATYYKNISGNQWGQHSNYDLLINSSIGIEKTANIILQYIASKQNH
ncbi:cytidylate kinase family protein [Clostridioides difficile]|uniref:cytidylate kinase family protein n=1 Tax=Clostridioides difficile TaxID=1496 RepID=UPI0009800462|nr:cytidylate kinase family protein [Clostridioides difficile]SJT73714.1 Multidrug export protein mepA [Clostridioides difficile]HBF5909553.1 cytidylate kinase family protein [Clostridioides difficile]HBF6291917.1 cytidylate kinase family protein [Clostridioides difficile]HBG8469804.1 cytidylate kinase family protein [Clostridioides difficile]HDO9121905.1 cytidylate kinase family protein [Clostridioides difficile]